MFWDQGERTELSKIQLPPSFSWIKPMFNFILVDICDAILFFKKLQYCVSFKGFLGGSDGKESTCNAGDLGSIPGSGRSPGEGNGNPLQYSCLENSIDRGAWRAILYGVTKSWT